MTEEQIKESLSKHFIGTIGAFSGYKLIKPDPDNGVDLLACKVLCRTENGKQRFFDDSNILRFQLKATCQSEIIRCENSIKYDLKTKNYNDLVSQKPSQCASPLTLILCVLPNIKEDWVNLEYGSLAIFSEAFYYQAEDHADQIPNENSTKRIEIPLENRITENFIDELYRGVFQ